MIDLEKLVAGLVCVIVVLVCAGGLYRAGLAAQPPCPEPIPVVCMVKATHPATDGGEMLTVHCPPEEA